MKRMREVEQETAKNQPQIVFFSQNVADLVDTGSPELKEKELRSASETCVSKTKSNARFTSDKRELHIFCVKTLKPTQQRQNRIFSRDPLCKNTYRYCRCQPCDVGVEHDDHTCYSCEQRLLHPGGVPGAPWQPPLTPGCESWCAQCTSQRCAVRGLHELHVCMHTMKFSTPKGGGDPWAAPE